MQYFRVVECFKYKDSVLCSALYARSPYYLVLYMQSVRIIYCFILGKVSVLCTALYAKEPWLGCTPTLGTKNTDTASEVSAGLKLCSPCDSSPQGQCHVCTSICLYNKASYCRLSNDTQS